ncbi:MAG: hypothetical protein H6657_17585 [Ardenticatenaceae bacterium]|nr:hypothetical protein [Ardenticatenaceae bacterium]
MNDKMHNQVRAWLESEKPLGTGAETAVQTHLQTCANCRAYADLLAQLRAGTWNPYPTQPLTQTQVQRVVNQIHPQLRRKTMTPKAGLFNLPSALGLAGLLVFVGLFALLIAQLNQTAVPPTTFTTTPSFTDYDGWETGLAFEFPATWTMTGLDTDGSAVMTFATPLDETAESCETFMAVGSSATVWIVPADANIPATPLDFMTRFVLTPLAEPEAVTVNGRSAAYALSEIPCAAPYNQMTIMAAQTETHYALVGLRHAPDDAATVRTKIETIISSLTPVDYTGWQPWRPNGFFYTVMAPTGWNVFDSSKSLEVTPSQQPMWSSFAVPDQPADAPRITIAHNLNAQFGETALAMVARYAAQMQADLPTLQEIDPPATHPIVPGVVTAVYTTEDTAVFFGAINYPRDNVSLDPIGATATVPLDQLDSFRPIFERVLRSLNGYYEAIPGVPVREAFMGGIVSDITPTATPVPFDPSQPTATFVPPPDDGSQPTATPTALALPLAMTPTATPISSTAVPGNGDLPTPTQIPSPTPVAP